MKNILFVVVLCVIGLSCFLLVRHNAIPCDNMPEGDGRDGCYKNWAIDHTDASQSLFSSKNKPERPVNDHIIAF